MQWIPLKVLKVCWTFLLSSVERWTDESCVWGQSVWRVDVEISKCWILQLILWLSQHMNLYIHSKFPFYTVTHIHSESFWMWKNQAKRCSPILRAPSPLADKNMCIRKMNYPRMIKYAPNSRSDTSTNREIILISFSRACKYWVLINQVSANSWKLKKQLELLFWQFIVLRCVW